MTIKTFISTGSLLLVTALFSISLAADKTYTVCTWGNNCKGAISHTFDDYGQSSVTNAAGGTGQAAFDAKGFHSTIFVITGQAKEATWTNCRKAYEKGHEIASHSVTHPQTMPASELAPSQSTIKTNVPGEMCVTVAYPNCNTPGKSNVLKTYIAGRNCTSSLNNKSPSDFSQINAKGFGFGSGGYPNTASDMNDFAKQAANNNCWAVCMHHGVGNDTHSWAVTNLDSLKGHINFLDSNRTTIWIESFGNVARYIKERDGATVTQTDSTASSFTITVKDNLPDSIFNYPLSILRPFPAGWDKVFVKQGGKLVDDTTIEVSSVKYIMFKAVPDGGEVVIARDTIDAVVQHCLKNQLLPVVHKNSVLSINRNYFSGKTVTVIFFTVAGKVISSKSLSSTEHCIDLRSVHCATSTFIARISDGQKSYSGIFMPKL